MLKKIFIALSILIGLAVVAAAALFIWVRGTAPKTDKEFLGQLKGEVVFTRRNADDVSDIWKINADGTGEKMLYHNDKYGGPAKNFNSILPEWSIDGEKIYFKTIREKGWEIFEMDKNGKNINIIKNPDNKLLTGNQWSREKDIRVFKGDMYIIKDGQEVKIFKHSGYYNQDYAASSGAGEASWSPDKEYIIFEVEGFITVADRNGRITKVTKGSAPDWKY